MQLEVQIRPYRESDWPLIFDAWWRAAWSQHQYEARCGFPSIPLGSFKNGMRSRIRRLLNAGQCLVATSHNGKDYILGFIVWQCWAVGGSPLRVVHAIWVRGGVKGAAGFRRMGVATQLLERAGIGQNFAYTQHSGSMGKVRKRWRAHYNPFLMEV